MGLNQPQTGAAGQLAGVMTEAANISAKLAQMSLQIDQRTLASLRAANMVQAKAVYNSLQEEARKFSADGKNSLLSAATTGSVLGTTVIGSRIMTAKALSTAKAQQGVAGQFETELRENYQARQMNVGAQDSQELDANIQRAKDELVQSTPNTFKDYENYGTEESRANMREAIKHVTPDEYNDIMKNVKKGKEQAENNIQNASQKHDKYVNYAQIVTRMMDAIYQSITSQKKASIDKTKSQIDMINSLSQYINQILQHLSQMATSMFQKERDAMSALVQKEGEMARRQQAV